MYKNITPQMIAKGLFELDRRELSDFLAIFEDASAFKMAIDKFKDYKSKKDATGLVLDKDSFSQRIYETAQKINNSKANADDLRTALLSHIFKAFGIDVSELIVPRTLVKSLDLLAEDISAVISESKNKDISDKLFKDKTKLSFEDAVVDVLNKLFSSAMEDNFIGKDNLLKALQNNQEKINEIVINKSGVSNITNKSLTNIKNLSIGLGSVAGITQLSGFSAYILAANMSSVIPLIGGKTMISLLAVVANPMFVVLAIGTAGFMGADSLSKNAKRTFASIISSIIAAKGMLSSKDLYNDICPVFFGLDISLSNLKNIGILDNLELPNLKGVKDNISLPSKIRIDSVMSADLSERGKDKNLIHSIIFPDNEINETIALAGLTIGDFIYDLASIDAKVVEAADFARTADLSSPFNFAKFSEGLEGLPIRALTGHKSNIMGYTAERIVASKLVEAGHIVSLPETSNQAGYDLIVDGKEFQVKCIKPENFAILEEHFDKYPDTPSFVNSEISELILEKNPEWADQVFFIEGYSYDFANNLVEKALHAGQELGDYEIISSISIISLAKNIHGWWKGQQSINSSAFNILLDTATKGSMAVLGGFVGGGIGMLMFGPAGAYIFGGLSSFAGAVKGRSFAIKLIDKNLFPERELRLSQSADNLIIDCNKHLLDKLSLINLKINSLPSGDTGLFVKNRFEWEKAFIQKTINKNNSLLAGKINGLERAKEALKLSSESGVHAALLQTNYKEIISILNERVDRVNAIRSASSSFVMRFVNNNSRHNR